MCSNNFDYKTDFKCHTFYFSRKEIFSCDLLRIFLVFVVNSHDEYITMFLCIVSFKSNSFIILLQPMLISYLWILSGVSV